jgi:isopenicillin N synthase-like dioxygenase
MQQTVPIIDLQLYIKGTNEEQMQFVKQLGEAYETTGFVAVVNHGISDQLIKSFYENVTAFFARPVDEKLTYEIPELAGQRGYTSFGREKAKGFQAADLKEFWQFGQTVIDGDAIADQYPDNVEVPNLPDFNTTGKQLYQAFEQCGTILLQAIARHLGLNDNYFDPHVHNGNSILRAIHYPPITSEPASAIRAEQHEDINLITLLVGASAEGLELLNRDNEWKAIVAEPGQIIVNVGDMLQRLTNNRLKSTTHRVVNPPRERWHMPRLSIPFFLHPRSNMALDCLHNCISDTNPIGYQPITAGEYLDERLREIGLKK